MKTLIAFFLLMCSLNSKSQEIKYKPVFYDQCSEIYNPLLVATLYKDSELLSKKILFDTSYFTIIDTGQYFIKLYHNLYVDSIPFRIDTLISRTDTFNLKSIVFDELTMYNTPCSCFLTCNDTMIGRKTDYYSNGHIRFSGYFQGAVLRDSIYSEYKNGQTKEYYIKKKGSDKAKYYFEYYENGNIKAERNRIRNLNVTYYKNGNTKSKWKSGLIKIDKKYHSNGNLAYKKTCKWEFNFNESGKRITKEKLEETRKQKRKKDIEFKRMYKRINIKPNYSPRQTLLGQRYF